ncbi:helix-turn-helix transcriptional regulator [Enterococcus sp. PF-2]|uniref:helix-turn-helix domain-containing protein n=1 Tax=unclassified Enterococcus TaxID=2608891 RepID=UPI00111F76CC|nr:MULTISPECIES: helix-turn-helix transcriptional regulator [unclassified Enterococcus]TPE00964.1 helix-turn-helix transcriptional regulator [Enterococcus sp. PF-3]TPE24516.1 helix-turn-helix transcriptional regulator [Enterococcus sp. PF-2]
MFGLLKPNKEQVGSRLREVKDALGLSFSEYGNRLGLIKPTINSYVRGYSLAPLEVVEKVSELSGKPVGWFYFGEIEEYIKEYLLLRGQEALLKDHSDVPLKIKEDFLTGDFKNLGWETDFGYPVEKFIDDCYAEIHAKLLREHIQELTLSYLTKHIDLEGTKREDAVIFLSSETMGYYEATRDFDYGDTEKILSMIENRYERTLKEKEISFDDGYLVGKLINILADDDETEQLISVLSKELTGKRFSTFFGGNELIQVFQSLRPELLKLYAETTSDDYHDWFEK